jgi:hypothetical protein
MSTWVIPYVDQDLAFWNEIAERFGPKIKEVYFPMPDGVIASGRPPQPERFLQAFLRHAPLPKAVLLNPIVLLRPIEEIGPQMLYALRRLRDEWGVTAATVASPALARLIKRELPDFTLTASTLMGIGSPAQAIMVRDFVDGITPHNSLVRDRAALNRLRTAFPGELRLIVNEACIPGCLHRTQHFYEMAYSDAFPQSLCQAMLEENPWLRLTGAWILPRHLHFYEGLYDTLKLAGRVTLADRNTYLNVLSAYVERRDILPAHIGGGPASPPEAVPISDRFFELLLSCDKNCHICSVCRDYFEEALKKAREENDGRRE